MIPWWFPSLSQGIIDFTLDKFTQQKYKNLGIRPGYYDQFRKWSDIIELGKGSIDSLGPQVKPGNPFRPPGAPGPNPPTENPAPGIHQQPRLDLDHKPPGPGVQVGDPPLGPLWEAQARTNPMRSFFLKPMISKRKRRKFKVKMKKYYVAPPTFWSAEMDVDPVNRARKPAGSPPGQRHSKRHHK